MSTEGESEWLGTIFEGAEFVPAYCYRKWDTHHASGPQTGTILHLNTVKYPLAVVDIDYKRIPQIKKDELKPIILGLIPDDCIVIETAHGGFHIYTKHHYFPRHNRYPVLAKTSDFVVDVFFATQPESKSNLVFPPSQVKDREFGPILEYHIVKGDVHAKELHSIDDVIEAIAKRFNLPSLLSFFDSIKEPYVPPEKEYTIPKFVNERLFKSLIEGMKDILITRAGKVKIEELFETLNSYVGIDTITQETVDEAYKRIKEIAKFEDDALMSEWDEIKEKKQSERSRWGTLTKIVRENNPLFYRDHIAKLFKME